MLKLCNYNNSGMAALFKVLQIKKVQLFVDNYAFKKIYLKVK